MNRTNKKSKKPFYRKITPGNLHIILDGGTRTRIKPKEVVQATEEDLGKWLSEFELVSADVISEDVKARAKGMVADEDEDEGLTADVDGYTIEHTGGGWHNVLSPTGKVMNDAKLRAEDADALLAHLEGEQESDEESEED
jgi:hypothetical protein